MGDHYEEFFRREYPQILKMLMRIGATYEEADDATQRAMIDTYSAWPKLAHPCSWARVAAVRFHVKEAERDRKRLGLEALASRMGRAPAPHVADPGEHGRVMRALRGLPRKQREVLALKYDGFENAEISRVLGVQNAETVRSNLRHARKALQQTLAAEKEEA